MEDNGAEAWAVLVEVGELRQVELAAGAALLHQAARWADLHPALEPALAATYTERGRDTGCRLGGVGVPEVAVDCVAELAAALTLSTGAGERLIGHAPELRHRLPRLWALVHDGQVAAWQARQVAERTLSLTAEAAGFVDAQVAVVVGRIGLAQLDRLVSAAVLRFMPEEAERRRLEAAEGRCFTVEHDRSGQWHGLSDVFGRLDLPDALALDTAVAEGARALAELGSTDPLDVRRARAVGELARRQPSLDLLTTESTADEPTADRSTPSPSATAGGTAAGGKAAAAAGGKAVERIVLYLHLSQAALGADDGSGRVENTGAPVTADQIRDWCARPQARVTVKPVIDLNTDEAVEGYRIPGWMREKVALRDRACVFAWCSRPAHPYPRPRDRDDQDEEHGWSCDTDHIIAHSAGGPTSTDNPAPLCRAHHLLKDLHRLALPGDRTTRLPVDQPPRPALPPHPRRRHHRPRPTPTQQTPTPPASPATPHPRHTSSTPNATARPRRRRPTLRRTTTLLTRPAPTSSRSRSARHRRR